MSAGGEACAYCDHALDGHAFAQDPDEFRHACVACPHGLCPSRLDLGFDHFGRWTCWEPDRELNPQYEGIPDVSRYGLIIDHPNPRTGDRCHSAVTFDTPTARILDPNRPKWAVESLEPLHLEPSILCRFTQAAGEPECGDHGYIRNGRWVPA